MKTALLVGAMMIGGVSAGIAVERAGLVSLAAETTVIAAFDEVPYFSCPDDQAVGNLHRGDRVFVTGVTEDRQWAEIRAPYDTDFRVLVGLRWLIPDTEIVGAAIAIPLCAGDDDPANGADHTSTTTTTTSLPSDAPAVSAPSPSTSEPSSDTSTTTSSTTTSTSSTTTTTSTATTTTMTTTLPADQAGPVVNFFQSTAAELWEDANFGNCNPGKAMTAAISAVVFDPSGISSVQLAWNVGSSGGTLAMSEIASDVYSVTIGPFPEDTIAGSDASISLTLTARDALSNSTSVSSGNRIPPLLHDCVIG